MRLLALFASFVLVVSLASAPAPAAAPAEQQQPLYKANLYRLAANEELRIIKEHTDAIVADFYSSIVAEAKLGYTEYLTQLRECPVGEAFNVKPAIYDAIIQRVFAEIPLKFPDADITYNEETNVYRVAWL